MSQHKGSPDDQVDLATITADDLLLDALGRGDGHPGGDDVAAMLAAWRAEVTADGPDAEQDAELVRAAIAAEGDRGTGPPPRAFRIGRRLVGAAAAVVVAGGLALGSHQAGPTSPLWPLAKVVYPQQAEVRTAEYAIDRARAATAAGHYGEARRLLDEALTHIARIADPAVATRLRTDVETILRELPTANPELPPSTPTPQPAPARTPTQKAVPPPEPAPAVTGNSPAPQQPTPDQGLIPEIAPALPVPTLSPLPEPSGLLPELPLPPGGLLN